MRLPGRGAVLAALCLLFAARVVGQALQRWWPQPSLPPFASFQGSTLPYGVLLAAQIAILALMARTTLGAFRGGVTPREGHATILLVLGSAYLALALLRIAIGLTVAAAPAWFSAWIPAAFHVVLALFVLLAGELAWTRSQALRLGTS